MTHPCPECGTQFLDENLKQPARAPQVDDGRFIEAMATALNDSKENANLGFSYNERLASICFNAILPYLRTPPDKAATIEKMARAMRSYEHNIYGHKMKSIIPIEEARGLATAAYEAEHE